MKKMNRIILVVVLLLAMSTTVFGAEYVGADGLENIQPADTLVLDKDVMQVTYTAQWEKMSAEESILLAGKVEPNNNNVQSPKTGDSSDFRIYGAIALIALGLFVALGAYGYKKNKRIISFMVLLFAFSLTVPVLTSSEAFATEPAPPGLSGPVDWQTVGISDAQPLTYSVIFKEGTDDLVTNLPADIPSCTEPVFTTPNNVPERAGYKFTGWKINILKSKETSYTIHFDGVDDEEVTEDIIPARTIFGLREGQSVNLNDALRQSQSAFMNKNDGTLKYEDHFPVLTSVDISQAGIPDFIRVVEGKEDVYFHLAFDYKFDSMVLSANPDENVIRIPYYASRLQ